MVHIIYIIFSQFSQNIYLNGIRVSLYIYSGHIGSAQQRHSSVKFRTTTHLDWAKVFVVLC